ncbi:MAG: hypothetical protein JSS71_07440 [Armatimonadetes bacterium]|nr:hypothetical protein [Armatimonadota bacterium]MBX3109907.1 hypothetical protein [Fimbriimonadaceae bacterium]
MVSFLLTAFAPPPPDPTEMYEVVCRQFASHRTGYFRESIGSGSDPDAVMFNWGLGVVLSAENALARLDPSRKPRLVLVISMAETYWNPQGPVPGFDVNPGPPFPEDRYYDDNAWMAMALVESYEVTGDRHCLELAGKAIDYCLSGLDRSLGGGIYWRENHKESKNTCSNGPTAAACLAVYRHTKEPRLLAAAQDIYAWTKKNLQDPKTHLFWDNMRQDGSVDKTFWSYNTALMIRAAKGLAQATGQSRFGEDAAVMQRAAMAKWLKPAGVIDDETQFAHLLFENLDPGSFDYRQYAATLAASRNNEGLFGTRWGQRAGSKSQMLHQAAAIRALAVAELWSRAK